MDLRWWRHMAFSAFAIFSTLSLLAFGQLDRPAYCDEGGSFKPVLICYFGAVTMDKPPGNFSIRDFNASTCTHLVYSFATIDRESSLLKFPENYSAITTTLKIKKMENPCLKVILAVGGSGDEVSKTFKEAVHNENSAAVLVDSIVDEVAHRPWDGVDIDWEYPVFEDQKYFTRFMKVLQCRLRCRICSLSMRRTADISIALSGSPFSIEGPGKETQGYNFTELNNYVDYYNVMAYDYHWYKPGDRDQKHHAPVYRHHTDKADSFQDAKWERVNALDSLITLKCAGADVKKLVLGFPTYGYIWQMQFPWSHEYGRTSSGIGPAGPFLAPSSGATFWTMSEFCYNLTTSKRQWNHVFDYEVMTPYAYTADNSFETYWYSYDNELTVIEKTDLAVGNNRRYTDFRCNPSDPEDIVVDLLAGMMIWTIEYDDCNNICQGWVSCPLISAARKRLDFWAKKYRTEYEATTTTTTTTTTEGPEPEPVFQDSKYCEGFTGCDPQEDCPVDKI